MSPEAAPWHPPAHHFPNNNPAQRLPPSPKPPSLHLSPTHTTRPPYPPPPLPLAHLQDLVYLLLEVHVQQLVGLVQHQVLELLQAETLQEEGGSGGGVQAWPAKRSNVETALKGLVRGG